MAETVTQAETVAALRMPWREAGQEIHAQLKIGRAIKNQRIRDQWELDHARAEKAEWIRRTHDLLTRIFASEAAVEQFSQHAATVLPEYAEFDLFIDQFEEEMRHRLALLQGALKQLENMPEALPSASGAAAESAPPTADETGAHHEVEVEVHEPVTVLEENDMVAATTEATIASVLDEASKTVTLYAQPPALVPAPPRPPVRVEASGLLIFATSDEGARKQASEFLHELGLKIEVIDRAVSPGKSASELLGQEKPASFAVVVADAAAIKEASGELQFELGFCAGRLGAHRVCVASATSEPLTDRHGIKHLTIDTGGGWQLQLARHLKRAGVPVDLNRLC
ncbi:MAG TPA: TIR domain-containing protein [Tepidisphaeraceae bacterium]|jgi:hypothetical protein